MARVSVEIENHVAKVTLTRGDKMNAVDPEMKEAIVAAGEDLLGREDIRAVVLSGEGRAFCAGLDMASFGAMGREDPMRRMMERTHGLSNISQRVATVWREMPVPVIAAVHGVAYGAGLQLAIGADIRVAAPDAKLSIMEMKWGLVPDMGGMPVFRHNLRSDVLRLLTYTAEPVTAEQGLAWGLVTELAADPLARAMEIATLIAGKSPSAIRAAKRLIDFAESGADEKAVLLEESREQANLIGGAHQKEVIAANMEKRAARFD
ncbi:crotonase/enoyl-CoA hydratase family protein [Pseudooceanicola nanhaiensis]|jgi:enoyl-CoA hydratase/carnithine racemase|uniref:Enoyl-CoA hydratase n=2 Tax=Pseudooceanicola nanhaiensis TaxID=375761 RepID=A0A917WGL3_9RHOB|nr:crotonase/enoyl-CoA hydratase family protein [Pseudooceanicola nanhaiensis]GGM02538.1 enoyl-CoA hydratase [Pseudooceanicola nanhaiensis]